MKHPAIVLSDEERKFVDSCSTPEKAQGFLDSLAYNWEPDGISTLRSLRRVLRDQTAHCLEGAVAAAAILSHHGYRPWLFYLDALDICHALFLYRHEGRYWGAVSKSRDPNLGGRPPVFRTLWDLAMSYYPYYYNYFTGDKTELTLRGYSRIDLDRFKRNLITAEEELNFIEDHVYDLDYRALFPRNQRQIYRFVGRTDQIIWIRNPAPAQRDKKQGA